MRKEISVEKSPAWTRDDSPIDQPDGVIVKHHLTKPAVQILTAITVVELGQKTTTKTTSSPIQVTTSNNRGNAE